MGWRFTDESVIGAGHWYLNWGDPFSERFVTLTDVIQIADNPVWCRREHAMIVTKIVSGVGNLLDDMRGMYHRDGTQVRIGAGTPMEFTVLRAHQAVQHALALLVDALVECRRGPVERALTADQQPASLIAFTMSDALNCCYQLAMRLPQASGE